jgi:DNA polymerase-1
MLLKLQSAARPTHAAALWDGGLAPERLAAWPGYKAQRPAMPDALASQLHGMSAWLKASGIPSGCRPGVEADDWIAALAARAERDGWSTVIASPDKDFMQLVSGESDKCRVAGDMEDKSPGHSAPAGRIGLLKPLPGRGTGAIAPVWTAESVRIKTGVQPAQIVDWLSLTGDGVDNIPGVPGVGPKTAAELLRQFGSVAALYARLPDVKSARVRAALAGAADAVRRNQQLIRLRTDLPCGFAPAELAVQPPDADALRALYARWGFRSASREPGAGSREQGAPSSELRPPSATLRAPRSGLRAEGQRNFEFRN